MRDQIKLLKQNDIVRMNMAHISGLKASKLMRELFDNNDETVYVKCRFNKKFNKWEPFERGQKEDIYGE